MKKRPWVLFVICVAAFIVLRLLGTKRAPEETIEKIKPVVPEPMVVHNTLLCHPWVMTQPKLTEPNIEMVRDLAALEEICKEVKKEHEDLSYEQIVTILIETLINLQKEIPFKLPEDLYSVLCIPQTPQEIYQTPSPFHVYKRLYLGEMESGIPFYLDVRVFELEEYSADELIAWHLNTLDGEETTLYQSKKRAIYIAVGNRTRGTAHGFAIGKRGLFLDCIEQGGKLFVLYAEAPLKNFEEQEPLFKQFARYANVPVENCTRNFKG